MGIVNLLHKVERNLATSFHEITKAAKNRLYELAQYKDDLARVLASGGHIDVNGGDRPVNPFITNPLTGKSLIHTIIETDSHSFARLFYAFKENPNTLWYKVSLPQLLAHRDYNGKGPTVLQSLVENGFSFNELDVERIAPMDLWQSRVVIKSGINEFNEVKGVSLLEYAYSQNAISSKAYMKAAEKLLGGEQNLQSSLDHMYVRMVNRLDLLKDKELSDPERLNNEASQIRKEEIGLRSAKLQEVFENNVKREVDKRLQSFGREYVERVLQILESQLDPKVIQGLEENLAGSAKSMLTGVKKQFKNQEEDEFEQPAVSDGGMGM